MFEKSPAFTYEIIPYQSLILKVSEFSTSIVSDVSTIESELLFRIATSSIEVSDSTLM